LRDGVIVRVKKGLYVFGEAERRNPYCRELLANLLYGPSYISLEYALARHGLIPERVETVTSVTCGRSRAFDTPVGRFTYRRIPLGAFPIGMDLAETGDGRFFFLATPEKALADKLVEERGAAVVSQKELLIHLTENLRIEESVLRTLEPERLANIAGFYKSRKLRLLAALVGRLKRR
jgi:hypothetical protein